MDERTGPSKLSGKPMPSRLPVLSKRTSQLLKNSKPGEDRSFESPRSQKRSSVLSSPVPSANGTSYPTAYLNGVARPGAVVNGVPTSLEKRAASHSRPPVSRTASRSSQRSQVQSRASSTNPNGTDEQDSQPDAAERVRARSTGFGSDRAPTPAGNRSRNGSRPSLSDRTVESISNLPATPGTDRRRSSFFSPMESPMGPPPRPTSQLGSSRPGSSEGNSFQSTSPQGRSFVSAKSSGHVFLEGFGFRPNTPARRHNGSVSSRSPQAADEDCADLSPSPSVRVKSPILDLPKASLVSSQQLSAELSPPISPDLENEPSTNGASRHLENDGHTVEAVGDDVPEPPKAVAKVKATGKVSASAPINSSSAALRQQIAAAKAAKRRENDKQELFTALSTSLDELGTHTDPFNQAPRDEKHILRNRINTARTDGRLNIAALGLTDIPSEVLQMYSSEAMQESNVNWAEVVDITKFIAADNQLERFSDEVFPDKTVEELAEADGNQGNQFGGLELLDLHGNAFSAMPTGLRRLDRLTKLDLSQNKLENSVLDILVQIGSLKELKLGKNNLSANLTSRISQLARLEVLDLQANKLLGLPDSLKDLTRLRILNVSGNQLTVLPMESLQSIPLVELDASSNALIASLFPLGGSASHNTLKILNISNNSLAALAFTTDVDLLSLEELNVSNNHLTGLPEISGWKELRTLLAGENKIFELPAGFSTLSKLRNVSFTGNDIRLIGADIAKMDSLVELVLAGNPLQQKKYLTMSTEDMKRDLSAKIEPTPVEDGEMVTNGGIVGGRARSSTAIMWTMKAGNTLDLAVSNLSNDINDNLGSFLQSNEVRQLFLQQNRLSSIPPATRLGTAIRVLDVSGNSFDEDYVMDGLELPALTELNMSRCKLSSLQPLMSSLTAPKLETLTITANRLGDAVPRLRNNFPLLTRFFADDNKFTTVSADALRGLHVVNLKNNDLQSLPAEIGLLWSEGLHAFEVGGNAFRVPSYAVLDKGTEAVMKWLKNKLPVGQTGPDHDA